MVMSSFEKSCGDGGDPGGPNRAANVADVG